MRLNFGYFELLIRARFACGTARRVICSAHAVKIQSGESGILPIDEDKICSACRRNFILPRMIKILSAKISAGSARDKI
ncbi:hypothetical protein [Campylobacter gracilis]|uniref:Uncharacterized protein n=1 Tax=Campylobacter gracilis RM3268 TaxID=553220 RepID=C8PER8_9BACT|nr:hypothetical protein [Campylobacter gracilis]EEV18546.1 hypothetical protein CAMGR0001_2557 [Campylobacter gracilis RM3268]UEB45914.1 hypothetical protein LK410_02120 [Campylobacter gracilis]